MGVSPLYKQYCIHSESSLFIYHSVLLWIITMYVYTCTWRHPQPHPFLWQLKEVYFPLSWLRRLGEPLHSKYPSDTSWLCAHQQCLRTNRVLWAQWSLAHKDKAEVWDARGMQRADLLSLCFSSAFSSASHITKAKELHQSFATCAFFAHKRCSAGHLMYDGDDAGDTECYPKGCMQNTVMSLSSTNETRGVDPLKVPSAATVKRHCLTVCVWVSDRGGLG